VYNFHQVWHLLNPPNPGFQGHKRLEMIELENINTILKSNVISITFEKVDGSIRVMRATLDPAIVPPSPPKSGGKTREPNLEVIPVWSIEDQGWRSFRKDLFISAEIV
jgi:hypothetical protein